ncbi:anti-sigma factor family protein [Agarilytica rhodophyticola]|uniref:anti-sigma factor family protein n=1 Tax=Agarilytica rhodophyticola TaxID=1737490 RepID=UPI000B347229|nr:hypothetical protein [Agarilytica rhodophyticola]
MNTEINDDIAILSAYIDEELSADERAAFEQRLTESAELREQLAVLKNNDRILQAAARELDNEPMPDNIQRLLNDDRALLEQLDKQYTETENAVPAPRQSWWNWQRSLAASITLAIGILGVQQYLTYSPSEAELLVSDTREPLPALQKVLSTTLSGNTIEHRDTKVTPELTFSRQDDVLCRQYRIQSRHDSIRGLACLENNTWKNKVVASIHIADESSNNSYQPASSKTEKDISRYIQDEIKGIPLNIEQETEVLNYEQ